MSASVRLRRQAGPLLRQVNGKPRREHDAMKEIAKPQSTKLHNHADYDRSPESSDNGSEDSDNCLDDMVPSSFVGLESRRQDTLPARNGDRRTTVGGQRQSKRLISSYGPDRQVVGRSSNSRSDDKPDQARKQISAVRTSEDEDDEVFGSSQRRRSQKQATYGSSQRSSLLQNIHACPAGYKEPVDNHSSRKHARDTFQAPVDAKRQRITFSKFKSPNVLCEKKGNNEKNVFRMPKRYDVQGRLHNEETSSPFSHSDDLAALQQVSSEPTSVRSTSPLSSPPPDSLLDTSKGNVDVIAFTQDPERTGLDDVTNCPICNATVSLADLSGFSGGKRLRWRDKLAFCQSHKQRSAEQQWSHFNYPKIDWDSFDSRLSKYRHTMNEILDGRKPSYYRNELEQKAASSKDKARNALRNPEQAGEEINIPGYYGPRGAQKMQEFVVQNFAGKVRQLSSNDALMLSTGTTGYVQAVLVPELAVLLVREDLGVDSEGARRLLRETAEFGSLVNKEEEAKVTQQNDSGIIHILSQDK